MPLPMRVTHNGGGLLSKRVTLESSNRAEIPLHRTASLEYTRCQQGRTLFGRQLCFFLADTLSTPFATFRTIPNAPFPHCHGPKAEKAAVARHYL